MAKYRKMLVAINLSEEAKQVLETAVDLRQAHNKLLRSGTRMTKYTGLQKSTTST